MAQAYLTPKRYHSKNYVAIDNNNQFQLMIIICPAMRLLNYGCEEILKISYLIGVDYQHILTHWEPFVCHTRTMHVNCRLAKGAGGWDSCCLQGKKTKTESRDLSVRLTRPSPLLSVREPPFLPLSQAQPARKTLPKSVIYTPKWGDEHSRPFHMGFSLPGVWRQQETSLEVLFAGPFKQRRHPPH